MPVAAWEIYKLSRMVKGKANNPNQRTRTLCLEQPHILPLVSFTKPTGVLAGATTGGIELIKTHRSW